MALQFLWWILVGIIKNFEIYQIVQNSTGISIIPDSALTVYDNTTNIVSQIGDTSRTSSFVCTLNKVKLLKDTSINQLYYNTLVDSCFSNTVLDSELMTNDDISVIMIIKNPTLTTEQGMPEYLSWTRDTTLDFIKTINNTTVSGVQTTNLMVYYGNNSISYTIPSVTTFNNKMIQICFRKREIEAKLYFNGSNIVKLNNFTYSIPVSSQGNLVFGNKAQVDIYEAYIFIKALTDYEMDMVVTRLLWKHEIRYTPLRAYLPSTSSDVATKYYADSLSFFKSPAASLLNMSYFRITNLLPPTNANDATNMSWVNSQGFLKSLLTSNLDAGLKSIINLEALINANNATTKTYVDNKSKNYQLLSGSISYVTSSTLASGIITFSLTRLYERLTGGSSGGYFWPSNGRVIKLAYNCMSNTLSYAMACNLYLIKNTTLVTELLYAITYTMQKGMKTYTTPIAYVEGDVLLFEVQNLAFQAPIGSGVSATNEYIRSRISRI